MTSQETSAIGEVIVDEEGDIELVEEDGDRWSVIAYYGDNEAHGPYSEWSEWQKASHPYYAEVARNGELVGRVGAWAGSSAGELSALGILALVAADRSFTTGSTDVDEILEAFDEYGFEGGHAVAYRGALRTAANNVLWDQLPAALTEAAREAWEEA